MALFARGTRRLLFRASSLTSRASLEGYYKTSTGLVGLDVNPNAREDFIKQQKALLEKIKVRYQHSCAGVQPICVEHLGPALP